MQQAIYEKIEYMEGGGGGGGGHNRKSGLTCIRSFSSELSRQLPPLKNCKDKLFFLPN
jgi:hypothetical protein